MGKKRNKDSGQLDAALITTEQLDVAQVQHDAISVKDLPKSKWHIVIGTGKSLLAEGAEYKVGANLAVILINKQAATLKN